MRVLTLRELLRLIKLTNLSNNRISQLLDISINTVKRYRKRCLELGLTWTLIQQKKDSELQSQFNNKRELAFDKRMPDFKYIHQLMQQHHQTLMQAWDEYCRIDPDDAYSYSQFTHHYRAFVKRIDVSMRQTHLPGEKCFVDFAGKRIPYTDMKTGKKHYAEIFVGVLGYSQLIFAKAIPSQKLEDWIDVHQDMLHYYGGVPKVVVPDNLKSAVTKPGKYLEVNRSYSELSQHYGFVIEPARVRKPQDKSLAEIGVLLVTRWITIILRRQQFFSVAEINKALEDLLEALNLRSFKRYEGNRRSRFEQGEQSILQRLPTTRFIFGRWMPTQKVSSNYHVYVLGHEYSVPFRYISDPVQARVTAKTIEIYFESQPIALHVRSFEQGGATTDSYHRPAKHQHYAAQSKEFFLDWAKRLGTDVIALVEAQFSGKQKKAVRAINACNKLQKLAKQYGYQRFGRACQCAVSINAFSASSVQSILQCHLDEQNDNSSESQAALLPTHTNVRGAEYYQQQGAK